ncbi:hypothetical protein KIN20_006540 [Parelaphostrongylus tenuis]|uniref:Uncharacterized protein n=1 Tax=Parelaphostrongylus tenuis TaxID=148309 RepID=A0AAD5QL36_PARTN|nr:hypothetical protein KIN20_006540 [Parelaphostrongylus tenuis]
MMEIMLTSARQAEMRMMCRIFEGKHHIEDESWGASARISRPEEDETCEQYFSKRNKRAIITNIELALKEQKKTRNVSNVMLFSASDKSRKSGFGLV